MSVVKSTFIAVAVALLAGCGGGGGGGDAVNADADAAPEVTIDNDAASAMLGVALYDSLAGLERMVALAGVTDRLLGPAGAAVTSACSAGTITSQKTTPSMFVLTAANCQLEPSDGLVYDGTWTLTVTSTSYRADGTCPTGAICQLDATVDPTNARFGYGTAAWPVFGTTFRVRTEATGERTGFVWAPPSESANFPGVGVILLGGELGTFQAYLPNGVNVWVASMANRSRNNLQMNWPIRARLTLDAAGITVGVDNDSNGMPERILSVPWSAFVE